MAKRKDCCESCGILRKLFGSSEREVLLLDPDMIRFVRLANTPVAREIDD